MRARVPQVRHQRRGSDVAPDRIALTNGCICCTVRDDLLAAAVNLSRMIPRPDHIVIECSGVSDPRAIAAALTSELAREASTINAVVCLVDAANVLDLGYDDTELVIDQAAASDVVLISKCDIVADQVVDQVETLLRDAQPSMRIARSTITTIPL